MKLKSIALTIIILIMVNLILGILPHIAVKPFWILGSENLKFATIFEAIYTLLILPVLLLFLNKKINEKRNFKKYLVNAVLMISAVFLSNHFHYQNFADMTGKGDSPDKGTAIAKIVVLVGGIVVLAIGIGIKLIKDSKIKKI